MALEMVCKSMDFHELAQEMITYTQTGIFSAALGMPRV
jgi:hypothetical protein